MALEPIDASLPVTAFFTTRAGGVSGEPYSSLNIAAHVGDDPEAVARNRALVAEAAGAEVSFMTARHGADVVGVPVPGAVPSPGDVLITTVPGVALAAIAADCVPVLLHDSSSGAVAAVHAGRKGLVADAVGAALDAFADIAGREREAPAATVAASIGPAICGRCYEVPEGMRAEVAREHPHAFATTCAGTAALDLPAAIAARLRARGATVTDVAICALEDHRFFSYRREPVTGRQAAVIVCP